VEVWPARTNAAFLARCLRDADFQAARIDTGFIDERLPALVAPPTAAPPAEAVGALDAPPPGGSAWSPETGARGFRLGAEARLTATLRIDGALAEAPFAFGDASVVRLADGDVIAFADGAALRLSRGGASGSDGGAAVSDGTVRTPMPGRIVRVAVSEGEIVRAGQTLLVLEAMKMEHVLTTPMDGEVLELTAAEGDQVTDGVVVARITARTGQTPA